VGFLFFNTQTMSHFLYILHSKTSSKFYVGETHDVQERILKHNQHEYANAFSKIANDWTLAISFECNDRSEALFLERFIKKMKSKIFIEKIIQNPEILSDILSKK
jgi:putative endonuclease